MGVCCESNNNKQTTPIIKKYNNNDYVPLIYANPDPSYRETHSSNQTSDKRSRTLQRGNVPEMQAMLSDYPSSEINEYTFSNSRTLLIEAVIKCPNVSIIKMIMDKGANIDIPELATGNTALFLSALDLKIEFVGEILKYNPNIKHINKEGMNIFDFLHFHIFEQRKALGREVTQKEEELYKKIIELLKKYK
jgi:hypothetical protein